MKQQSSNLNSKDAINIGIFTAIIVILNMLVLSILHFLPGIFVLFKEALVAFILAPVYVLLWIKVPKRGVFTSCAIGIGLSYAVFGFFTVAIFTIIGGILSDYISNIYFFSNKNINAISYSIFSLFKTIGTYIPFYLWGNQFISEITSSNSTTETFLNFFKENLSISMGIYILIANILSSIIGVFFGYNLISKRLQS